MDDRYKELIAVGASVTANCQSCLEYHAGLAVGHGADEQDIAEAIGMGQAVRQGAGNKMDRFAAVVLKQDRQESGPVESGCGCT